MRRALHPTMTGGITPGPFFAEPSRSVSTPGRGYCVLSFDGGGFRGYASLLILQKLLQLVQPGPEPIYPHLYFDLICGTSTGGLIAILLAVLHLDIQTAIEVYQELGPTLFKNKWRKTRFYFKDAQFNHRKIIDAVTHILHNHGKGRELMDDPSHQKTTMCFVTTAHVDTGQNFRVHLVRSYHPCGADESFPPGHKWTIMDAVLATSAAPTYFKPHRIEVKTSSYTFVDAGAHRLNNPTDLAVRECRRMGGGDDASSSMFFSIGTGRPTRKPPKRKIERKGAHKALHNVLNIMRPLTVLEGLAQWATDVIEVEEVMNGRQTEGTVREYRRFNPEALGDIDLANHHTVPEMASMVAKFYDEHHAYFTESAGLIKAWHSKRSGLREEEARVSSVERKPLRWYRKLARFLRHPRFRKRTTSQSASP